MENKKALKISALHVYGVLIAVFLVGTIIKALHALYVDQHHIK